jgi:phosphatidylserine/phosphatidylglycerophosphate/cardiolipin synthase-like enzyme
VLDKKVVLTGSFNWTRAASEQNFENVVITNESEIVKSFVQEFERLWKLFEKNK